MVKYGSDVLDPSFSGFLLAFKWSLGHQDFQETALGFFLTGVLVNQFGNSHFVWKFLSMASYFGVCVVLLTMSFRAEPKYFPWLRQSGTYVLKDCKYLN